MAEEFQRFSYLSDWTSWVSIWITPQNSLSIADLRIVNLGTNSNLFDLWLIPKDSYGSKNVLCRRQELKPSQKYLIHGLIVPAEHELALSPNQTFQAFATLATTVAIATTPAT